MNRTGRNKLNTFFRYLKLDIKRAWRKIKNSWRKMSKKAKTVACVAASCVVLGVAALIIFLPASKPASSDEIIPVPVKTGENSAVQIIITASPTPSPTPTPDPTLKKGMESEEVRKLQIRLMELNFLDIDEPTLYFGPQTEAAVKLLQRQLNFTEGYSGEKVVEDGIAGPKTLELIYSDIAPTYVIKEGMEGTDIRAMQEQLVDLGYMEKTTSYYGTETVEAIKVFQKRNNLSSDGLAGEETVDLLYSDDAVASESKIKEARTRANIEKMIAVAESKLGCKYILGNRGPNSFDCSGLVYYCLNQAGSNRRRLNAAGYSRISEWDKISSINSLKRGDLIFFYDKNYTKVGHVGIVINSTYMIDASSNKGKVVKRSYKTSYWKSHFVCGRRPW